MNKSESSHVLRHKQEKWERETFLSNGQQEAASPVATGNPIV